MGTNVYASEQERLAGKEAPKPRTLAEEILDKMPSSLIAPGTAETISRENVIAMVLKAADDAGYEVKKKEPATPPTATETKEN